MELLSVIRRWHYRDHFSDPREISRRTGLSRRIRSGRYLRSDSVEPNFKVPDRAEQTGPLRRQAVRICCVRKRESPRKQKANRHAIVRRPSRLRLRRLIQSRGGLCPRLDGRSAARTEKTSGRGVYVPLAFLPGEAFQFGLVRKNWAIISGERTLNCRSPTSSSPTAALFILRAYLQQTHEMCCSTPITTPSAFWVACRGGAYTTICEPPSIRLAAARSARSTRGSRPWSATSCSRPSSAIRLPVGRKGKSRRTVQDARHRLWQPAPNFPSLAACRTQLAINCDFRPYNVIMTCN